MAVPPLSERAVLTTVTPQEIETTRDFSDIADERLKVVLMYVKDALVPSYIRGQQTVEETIRRFGRHIGLPEAYNGFINTQLAGPNNILGRDQENVSRTHPVSADEVYMITAFMDEIHRRNFRPPQRIDLKNGNGEKSFVGELVTRFGQHPLGQRFHDPYPRAVIREFPQDIDQPVQNEEIGTLLDQIEDERLRTYLQGIAREVIGSKTMLYTQDLQSPTARKFFGIHAGFINTLRFVLNNQGILLIDLEEKAPGQVGARKRGYSDKKTIAFGVIIHTIGRRTEYRSIDWKRELPVVYEALGEDSELRLVIRDPFAQKRKVIEEKEKTDPANEGATVDEDFKVTIDESGGDAVQNDLTSHEKDAGSVVDLLKGIEAQYGGMVYDSFEAATAAHIAQSYEHYREEKKRRKEEDGEQHDNGANEIGEVIEEGRSLEDVLHVSDDERELDGEEENGFLGESIIEAEEQDKGEVSIEDVTQDSIPSDNDFTGAPLLFDALHELPHVEGQTKEDVRNIPLPQVQITIERKVAVQPDAPSQVIFDSGRSRSVLHEKTAVEEAQSGLEATTLTIRQIREDAREREKKEKEAANWSKAKRQGKREVSYNPAIPGYADAENQTAEGITKGEPFRNGGLLGTVEKLEIIDGTSYLSVVYEGGTISKFPASSIGKTHFRLKKT